MLYIPELLIFLDTFLGRLSFRGKLKGVSPMKIVSGIKSLVVNELCFTLLLSQVGFY